MELTNEVKRYLVEVLDKLDQSNDSRSYNQNEYESGVYSGFESLSLRLREALGLEKCFTCGTFLDADHRSFCEPCREQHDLNKRY